MVGHPHAQHGQRSRCRVCVRFFYAQGMTGIAYAVSMRAR